MSFLEINGYEIPVSADRPTGEDEVIGGMERAFDGTLLSSERARKKSWSIETPPLAYAESRAVAGLLAGEGHAWDFEDDGAGNAWQYSSKGLPALEVGANTARSTAEKKFGAASLKIDAWTSGDLHGASWRVGAHAEWTFAAWLKVGGGDFTHWLLRVNEDEEPGFGEEWWRNGVRIDDSPGGDFIYEDDTLTLGLDGGSSDRWFDDLVFLPFRVTADMIPALHGFNEPFSPLRTLKLDGEINGDQRSLVRGEGIAFGYKGAVDDGAWHSNMRAVSATLREM